MPVTLPPCADLLTERGTCPTSLRALPLGEYEMTEPAPEPANTVPDAESYARAVIGPCGPCNVGAGWGAGRIYTEPNGELSIGTDYELYVELYVYRRPKHWLRE